MYPFSLSLHAGRTGGSQVMHLNTLPGVMESWKRGSSWIGLDDAGDFRITDVPPFILRQWFDTWLGYGIREWTEGTYSWRGIIYELELDDGSTRRRITLDAMANSIAAIYEEAVLNGGFEELDPGSPVFLNWTESGGPPFVTAYSAKPGSGTYSCQLTRTISSQNITQIVSVTGGQRYELSFSHRGDSVVSTPFKIYDYTNTADIVPQTFTGHTGTEYRTWREEFTVDASCTQIQLFFYNPSASGDCWIDDVSLKPVRDDRTSQHETAFADDSASQQLYGTKQRIVDAGLGPLTRAEAARDLELARAAWPLADYIGQSSGTPQLTVIAAGWGKLLEWMTLDPSLVPNEKAAVTSWASTALGYSDTIGEGLIDTLITDDALRQQGRQTIWQFITRQLVPAAGSNWARFWIDRELDGNLVIIDSAPTYVLRAGVLRDRAGGAVSPYLVQPAIVRDVSSPIGDAISSSAFDDPRDFLMGSVAVSPGGRLDWGADQVMGDLPDAGAGAAVGQDAGAGIAIAADTSQIKLYGSTGSKGAGLAPGAL